MMRMLGDFFFLKVPPDVIYFIIALYFFYYCQLESFYNTLGLELFLPTGHSFTNEIVNYQTNKYYNISTNMSKSRNAYFNSKDSKEQPNLLQFGIIPGHWMHSAQPIVQALILGL